MRIDFPGVVGTIEVYMDVMRAICGDTKGKSMIDLGCCFAPNTPKLGFGTRRYVDVVDRKLDHPEEQQYFIKIDARDFDLILPHIHFDVAIASDFIEHLPKQVGLEFMYRMTRFSWKQILFTPIGEIFKLAPEDDRDPETHKSLWFPNDIDLWNNEFPNEEFACIVFPDYHKVWNGGAFFFWRDKNGTRQDFTRVKEELSNKSWAQKKP